MTRTTFSLEIFGDRLPISDIYEHGTNEKRIRLMKALLRKAMTSELTEKQYTIVNEFYFNGASVTEIAEKYGVSKSTVSRHLSRARDRLKCVMKYGMFPLWADDT